MQRIYKGKESPSSRKILNGYQCYASGEKIIGNMQRKMGEEIIPGTSNRIIPEGQYVSGVQLIKGSSNLTADNIKKGTNLYNVEGNYEASYQWVNTSNGSYKFVKDGVKWKSNNEGVSSSTAESTWTITVPTSTSYTLYYRVSSENGYDKLTITLNGSTKVSNKSGEGSLSSTTLSLKAGENTLTASYTKDSTIDSYEDSAYLYLPDIETGVSTYSPSYYGMGNAEASNILSGKYATSSSEIVKGSMLSYTVGGYSSYTAYTSMDDNYASMNPLLGYYEAGSEVYTMLSKYTKVRTGTFTASEDATYINCGFQPKYIAILLYVSSSVMGTTHYDATYSTNYYFMAAVSNSDNVKRVTMSTDSSLSESNMYVDSSGFYRKFGSNAEGATAYYVCAG